MTFTPHRHTHAPYTGAGMSCLNVSIGDERKQMLKRLKAHNNANESKCNGQRTMCGTLVQIPAVMLMT